MNELHPDWITHRLPTEADADSDGDVQIPETPDACPSEQIACNWQRWSLVVPGQPWWSVKAAANPTKAQAQIGRKAREVVQIRVTPENESSYPCLYALCSDGSIFELPLSSSPSNEWTQIPPIPQPED